MNIFDGRRAGTFIHAPPTQSLKQHDDRLKGVQFCASFTQYLKILLLGMKIGFMGKKSKIPKKIFSERKQLQFDHVHNMYREVTIKEGLGFNKK